MSILTFLGMWLHVDQVLILLTERGEDICVSGSDISYALSWFSLCWKEESLVLAYVTVPLFCSHT